MPSRSTRSSRQIGVQRPSRPAVFGPAGHPLRQRRPRLPAQRDRARTTWSIFALPDSLTLVSTSANLRLESFLFTEQAFASRRATTCRRTGSSSSTTSTASRGSSPKLAGDAPDQLRQRAARPAPPRARQHGGDPGRRPGRRGAERRPPPGDHIDPIPDVGSHARRPATDDWPFLYLRTNRRSRRYYLVALAFVLLWALLASSPAARGVSGHARSAGSAPTSSCSASRSCCSRPAAS